MCKMPRILETVRKKQDYSAGLMCSVFSHYSTFRTLSMLCSAPDLFHAFYAAQCNCEKVHWLSALHANHHFTVTAALLLCACGWMHFHNYSLNDEITARPTSPPLSPTVTRVMFWNYYLGDNKAVHMFLQQCQSQWLEYSNRIWIKLFEYDSLMDLLTHLVLLISYIMISLLIFIDSLLMF